MMLGLGVLISCCVLVISLLDVFLSFWMMIMLFLLNSDGLVCIVRLFVR